MLRVAEAARKTDALVLPHLRIIANSTFAIDDAQIGAADNKVAEVLTPTRPRQAMVGPRRLSNKAGDIGAHYDEEARRDGTCRFRDPDHAQNPGTET